MVFRVFLTVVVQWGLSLRTRYNLDILFRQITTFIKVRVAFVFGLQTLWLIDFTKIYPLKGLKHKNKGHMNFYECCDHYVYWAACFERFIVLAWECQLCLELKELNTVIFMHMISYMNWGFWSTILMFFETHGIIDFHFSIHLFST